ncbi:MAG: hypothetical protein AAB831_00745 [Patescibacteria group bacterium]
MCKIVLVRSKALYALFKEMEGRTKELHLSEETIKKVVDGMREVFAAINYRVEGCFWEADSATLPRADRIDCVCGPSRVAIRQPVYSEGGIYGWQAKCVVCNKYGEIAKSRNVAAILWCSVHQ